MPRDVPSSFTVPGSELVLVRLDLAPRVVSELAALLCDAERQRAAAFRFDQDRRRYIAARGQLRRFLSQRLSVAPQAVALAYNAHGKPALARGGLHFNISRRTDTALFAFSRNARIGVDLEEIHDVPGADAIVARTFSRYERSAYSALASHERLIGFFNCWTRKEAFVKALGAGLSMPLDRFDVSLAPGEPARLLRVGSRCGEKVGWRLDSFAPCPGWVAAVASEDRRSH
jgi:4'-phosphopantetheinyl transferase